MLVIHRVYPTKLIARQFSRLRHFSTISPPNSSNKWKHDVIKMNSKGISGQIVEDGKVYKHNDRTGEKVLMDVDRAMGYFWMMKDLRENDGKPILTSTKLIDANKAPLFPPLLQDKYGDLTSLSNTQNIKLPQYFHRNFKKIADNDDDDSRCCTLVAVSFKQHGYQLLESWTKPFQTALCHGIGLGKRTGRAQVYQIAVQDGGIYKLFKPLFLRSWRNTVVNHHHNHTNTNILDNTLLFFGDSQPFRNHFKMYNTLTGYILLLDGLGRVRFVGSGQASDKEVTTLIECARELTTTLQRGSSNNHHH